MWQAQSVSDESNSAQLTLQLLALEWGDIDEETDTTREQKHSPSGREERGPRATKTESGKRTIPLNSKAMEANRHLRMQQVLGCPYVYATQAGEHVGYRHLLTTMANACEAAGVEHRGLHALRHSFASNLYSRGVEVKVISKLLGHASVEITYNRYIHFFEGDIDDTLRQAVGV